MKHLATLSLLLWAAAATLAQTPTVLTPPEGEPYTISSTSDASTTAATASAPTYQWYRDDNAIAGATSASYTVPASEASGYRVVFKRLATVTGCTGLNNGFSNEVVVSFGGDWRNVAIGGATWAGVNVDGFRNFATKPDMYTSFFQWNRITAWGAEGAVSGWSNTGSTATEWAAANDPCPTGWKLPTRAQLTALNTAGHSWAAANARGNAVPGAFYGSRHAACTLPNDMNSCIFIPATGYRAVGDGNLSGHGTVLEIWSSTQEDASRGSALSNNSTQALVGPETKAYGFNVRCVQE